MNPILAGVATFRSTVASVVVIAAAARAHIGKLVESQAGEEVEQYVFEMED